MSELSQFRDHARQRADWTRGAPRAACSARTSFGTPKPPDHANCGGDRCGCKCHEPSDRERAMWAALADEVDAYLSPPPEVVDLFGADHGGGRGRVADGAMDGDGRPLTACSQPSSPPPNPTKGPPRDDPRSPQVAESAGGGMSAAEGAAGHARGVLGCRDLPSTSGQHRKCWCPLDAATDRLLMRAGKAVHAAYWHAADGECLDPSDCGATVQDEAAALAVLSLLNFIPPTAEPAPIPAPVAGGEAT